MSKLKVAGRCLQELLLILLISLIPVGFGLMMMLYQHDQKHQENAHSMVITTIDAMDEALAQSGTPDAAHLGCEELRVTATANHLPLRNAVRGQQGKAVVLLEMGGCRIWRGSASPPSPKEFVHVGNSSRYGYTVTAGYPGGYSAQRTRRALMHTLPALALVGVVTGLIAYWSLFCHRGRRNRTAVHSA